MGTPRRRFIAGGVAGLVPAAIGARAYAVGGERVFRLFAVERTGTPGRKTG